MDHNLRDVVLKPIINRCRNHQNRKRVNPNKKTKDKQTQDKTFSKHRHANSNLGVEGISTDTLNEFISHLVQSQSLSTVGEMKQEIMDHVTEVIHPMVDGQGPSWFKRLSTEDINHLLVATDPISLTRSKIMSLPDTLSKMYEVSNKEKHPTIYHKDHVWLSLQWNIDGVHNPFECRPCTSTPCVGKFIVREDGVSSDLCSLPEMVPLPVMELFMEYRSQHFSTMAFNQLLHKMRTDTKEVATCWGLGRDVWGQPKCLLCYLKDLFSNIADTRNVVRKEISMCDYRSSMLVQFEGIRQELVIRPESHGFLYKLRETGVLLPSVCAPLPSSVISLLYQKGNGEICVDRLY